MVALALIAALGAYNHFRLVPTVRAKPDRRAGWARLGRTMRFEAIGMVVILALTGVLVNAIPSRTVESQRALYSATAPIASGSVNLVIDPARTGPTALHLYLLDAHGRSDDKVQSIDVQLTQSKLDIGPITRPLLKAGPGHYLTNGGLFTVPGTWTVTAEVRVDEFTENTATFEVKVRG
jgi:copper transport protein